jgi:hydroxymethylpyrimidine/phosphomethylpyrimidine kinase
MKQALTIAGSDSGGGAGIQADIKAMEANGVFAASVITAVTAQNTVEVREAMELPVALIRSQLDAVFDDLDIAAVKTGMLSSSEIIETVAAFLRRRGVVTLIVDPVMVSKSGFALLHDDAVHSLRRHLLPLARVVTPNLHEAILLSGRAIDSLDAMHEAARRIAGMGPRAVVVKGGHSAFAPGTDVLLDDGHIVELPADHVAAGKSIHGTGCTFSAAITARLALGESVEEAVRHAKHYVTRVIQNAPAVGHGHPPGRHFYFVDPHDFMEE